ncbi:UNVERIFIED_CONTAM: hypothetical protein Scaly_0469100 [Sesamum calycinum]|uniref:Uncharacterized protein n=1 Tax=Sesamum calycinum TaxID=2727403 RepID=A0AAW2SF85_9LAMI
MNPDSLLHFVLQHKYFPNSCNANFGAAPSYTCAPYSSPEIYLLQALAGDAKVAELINGNGWDEGLIISVFKPCDASYILSIKLPESNGRDVLVWHYEKSGKFSVRNAYLLVCDMADQANSVVQSRK